MVQRALVAIAIHRPRIIKVNRVRVAIRARTASASLDVQLELLPVAVHVSNPLRTIPTVVPGEPAMTIIPQVPTGWARHVHRDSNVSRDSVKKNVPRTSRTAQSTIKKDASVHLFWPCSTELLTVTANRDMLRITLAFVSVRTAITSITTHVNRTRHQTAVRMGYNAMLPMPRIHVPMANVSLSAMQVMSYPITHVCQHILSQYGMYPPII